MTTSSLRRVLALAATLLTLPALAQEQACLMEGAITLGGKTDEIKDCMLNKGVPQADFKTMCSGMANVTANIPGNQAGTVTYMAACPPSPQATCDGLFHQPLKAYYYKRAVNSLKRMQTGCTAQGGKWE